MSIERVRKIFHKPISQRFVILYGKGVDDVLTNRKLHELRFEEALFEELKRQGFNRILFFSPHQSLFFLDEESARLCRPMNSLSDQNVDYQPGMEAGPLPEMNILQNIIERPGPNSRRGMGDNHAIRLIDTVIRQYCDYRTAVVFLQAETTFRYFDDQRTLAGLVGDWNKLPSYNKSRCFFIFSVETEEQLKSVGEQLQIPEIRSEILRKETVENSNCSIVYIGGPQFEEARRIIYLSKWRLGLVIDESELEVLCQRIEAEGLQARQWLGRFEQINSLNIDAAHKAGWFSSIIDPTTNVWDRLDNLNGLDSVKARVKEIAAWLKVARERGELSKDSSSQPNLHMIFTGNPGTGKTTVARMFGEIFYEIGILKRGHLVEARASDLIADFVGGTAIKTNALIDRALDGVLFIDEAYALVESERGGFGQEALDTLLTRLENDRYRLVVIAAGYPDKMDKFRLANPGLSRRFPAGNIIYFEDFSPEQLWTILITELNQKSLKLSRDAGENISNLVGELYRRKDATFGNAGEMRNLAEGIDRRRASRLMLEGTSANPEIINDDIPPAYHHLLPSPISDGTIRFIKELDQLVGLNQVKARMNELATRLEYEYTRYRLSKIQANRPALQHLVFVGSPGTGKTTVARMVGRLYKSLGLLSKGHCVEVSRNDLVAGYVGQTAIRTAEKITSALDGILFIDEAYTLVRGGENDFGIEAIDTLVKMMEDNKDRLVVIAAGYPDEMMNFLHSNPGLISRFSEPILFEDYEIEELINILTSNMENEFYLYSEDVVLKSKEYFELLRSREGSEFKNARAALQLFDTMKTRLAQRVMPLIRGLNEDKVKAIISTFQPEDVPHPGFYLGQVQPKAQRSTWAQSNTNM